MGTIAGIVDGSGSFGSAFGQLIIGFILESLGWRSVYNLMGVFALLGGIPLVRLAWYETKDLIYRRD